MKLIEKTLFICCILALAGCSKDNLSYEKYSKPEWIVLTPELFPNSFTAIVALPDNLEIYSTDNDIVAAFIGKECRGIGNLVKSEEGEKRIYCLTIRASDTEDREIVFKYYNSRLSYLYQAQTNVEFIIDGTFGTFDAPAILDLENI